MAVVSNDLREILTECLGVARELGAGLEYEVTASSETESESTNVEARFAAERTSDASLNFRLLLDQLEQRTVVAAIDLFPPPQARLVIHGALKNRNYRIVIQL